MTYRRFGVFAVLFAVLLFILPAVPASAASAQGLEPQQEALSGDADILLLHENAISDAQLDSLRILADTATALGKSMEIGTPEQAGGLYVHYSLILCYDLQQDASLAAELVQSGAKLLVLGGELLPDCVQAADPSQVVSSAEESVTGGVLRFQFFNQKEFESIVDLPEHLYTGAAEYESGTLEAIGKEYPFCMQIAGIRYVPLTDLTADLARAALMQEISDWLWEYSGFPPQKGQYLVLDGVYPYMPAQELQDRVELFLQAGLPFVISVMPVYQNTDYPAMQQFCEVLRYAQSGGGAVILHAPILRSAASSKEDFNAVITDALEAYTSQGVYPLGFDVPYSWTWDTDALEWMRRSRSIFVYTDTDAPDFTRDTRQNLLYYNYNALVLPALQLDDEGANSVLQFSAARRIPASLSLDQLQAALDAAQSDSSPYYSLWDSEQSVWADSFHLSWKNGSLTLNDAPCSLTYTPQDYPEDYDYKRNTLQRFTVSIQNESHFLIGMVSVVILLFVLMILYARRQQRLHFLYRTDAGASAMNEGTAPAQSESAGTQGSAAQRRNGEPHGYDAAQRRNGEPHGYDAAQERDGGKHGCH